MQKKDSMYSLNFETSNSPVVNLIKCWTNFFYCLSHPHKKVHNLSWAYSLILWYKWLIPYISQDWKEQFMLLN